MAIALVLFVFGTLVGSFLNVCIWRMPRHESVAHPPSHCPRCDTRLQPADLVPLVSQLLLGGRCRYCQAKISWRYFGIEFLTGCLFTLPCFRPEFLDNPLLLAKALIFLATLVVIFWVDYDGQLIQMEAVLILGLTGVLTDFYQVATQQLPLTSGSVLSGFSLLPAPLPGSLLAMVVTAGFLWLLREVFSFIYQREAMGFGDVLLVAAISANLGWNATIFTFYFISFVGGLPLSLMMQGPSAVRAFRWGKARNTKYGANPKLARALLCRQLRRSIPFGPMLATAAVLALFFGENLNQFYLGTLSP